MMRPRLRGTVTYLRTESGMLFRNGDTFLPIKGSHVWELFQVAKPFLECAHEKEMNSPELEMILRGPLAKVLDALELADMLYESGHDVWEDLSFGTLERFRSERARLEIKSDSPLTRFAEVRAKKILIAGDPRSAAAIAEAALETGLRHLIIFVSKWTGEDEARLLQAIQTYRADGDEPNIEVCNRDITLFETLEWDELLVAASSATDCSLLYEATRTSPRRSQKCGIAMYSIDRRLWICACDLYAGCPGCVEEGLGAHSGTTDCADAVRLGGRTVIGARMLLRQFWDMQLEGLDSIARHTVMELDFQTHRIVRRPRTICSNCWHRRSSLAIPFEFQKVPMDISGDNLHDLEFCKRAESLCVDSKVGIIRVLDEGNLLQFPFHQCAALLEDSDGDQYSPWLGECGEEMLQARARTIRHALERYYHRRLLSPYAQNSSRWLYDSSGTRRCSGVSELYKEGVMVAAESWQELVHLGFYRALAKHAHTQSGWIMSDLAEMPDDADVRMVSEYLKDIGHLDDVFVWRKTSSRSDRVVFLRFHYRGRPVSVIAGTDWVHAWKIGLQDIWMYLSADETRFVQESQKPLAIKFRVACGATNPQHSLHETAELERCLGLKLCLFPVAVDESMQLLSLSFAYGCLTPATVDVEITDNIEQSISARGR